MIKPFGRESSGKIDSPEREELLSRTRKIMRESRIGAIKINWDYVYTFPEPCKLMQTLLAETNGQPRPRVIEHFARTLEISLGTADSQIPRGEKFGQFPSTLAELENNARTLERETSLKGVASEDALLKVMQKRVRRCFVGKAGVQWSLFIHNADNRTYLLNLLIKKRGSNPNSQSDSLREISLHLSFGRSSGLATFASSLSATSLAPKSSKTGPLNALILYLENIPTR